MEKKLRKKKNLKQRAIQVSNANSTRFSIEKAKEELLELALVLVQKDTKLNTRKPIDDQEIINEIGDAKRVIWWLEHVYGKDAVKKRIEEKVKKLEIKKGITS